MGNDMTKRLMWSGLLAGVGALMAILSNRVATEIWVRVFKEDPPGRLMVDAPNQGATGEPAPAARPRSPTASGAAGSPRSASRPRAAHSPTTRRSSWEARS